MLHSHDYLRRIGVTTLQARTCPFDPGYDPVTFASHIEQSGDLMSIVKISMACWLLAREESTRDKIAAARAHGVPVVTGGGPFEVAVAQGELPAYLDLCADFGVNRVECGEGFTDLNIDPSVIMKALGERGLDGQFELGKKHTGPWGSRELDHMLGIGWRWLEAGAKQLVIEARESARDVGLFDPDGRLSIGFAERLVDAFGLDVVVFEAPTKASQFAFLDHFGPAVHLCNVRLEELLRVEIYRRGLHSDAFAKDNLRPRKATSDVFAGLV